MGFAIPASALQTSLNPRLYYPVGSLCNASFWHCFPRAGRVSSRMPAGLLPTLMLLLWQLAVPGDQTCGRARGLCECHASRYPGRTGPGYVPGHSEAEVTIGNPAIVKARRTVAQVTPSAATAPLPGCFFHFFFSFFFFLFLIAMWRLQRACLQQGGHHAGRITSLACGGRRGRERNHSQRQPHCWHLWKKNTPKHTRHCSRQKYRALPVRPCAHLRIPSALRSHAH